VEVEEAGVALSEEDSSLAGASAAAAGAPVDSISSKVNDSKAATSSLSSTKIAMA
jgi:hypothetical protein